MLCECFKVSSFDLYVRYVEVSWTNGLLLMAANPAITT